MVNVPDFSEAKVLVIGDAMLDRYWFGAVHRISPEAPVPVVPVSQCENRLGGAANVALNLRALGCHTHLVGLCGEDEAAQCLRGLLEEASVEYFLSVSSERPTTTKLRVLSQHQQLIRLDFEDDTPHSERCEDVACLDVFEKTLARADAVILSDYHKGAIANPQIWIQAAIRADKPVFIDPKGSSFEWYRGATLLTPNRKEFEAVVGVCETEEQLLEKGFEAIKTHELGGILVTRGAEGMTLMKADGTFKHVRAKAQEVFDVTGAGDTVIATLAAGIAADVSWEDAVMWANIAAGCVVKKLGSATTTPLEMQKAVGLHPHTLPSRSDVLLDIDAARAKGETIVMTNGCFDILHIGHVTYLEQARALGHRLVVAVNDDDSVKRLKGETRPLNTLSHRMMLLQALQCVDWVVSFSEDTPLNVIEAVKPNVLVKGGDYDAETIVGAKSVKSWGGRVEILSFVDGVSTTQLVERIKGEKA